MICAGLPEARSSDMTVPRDDPLVGGEVARAHGAAGVELVGADADFGAQSVLASVGESCARIDHHAGGIDALDELVDVARRGAEDRVGVVGAVAVDVIDRFVYRADDFHAYDEAE